MKYQAGTYLFSGPDDEECLKEAREYSTKMGLTQKQVRIIRQSETISVVTKMETEWPPKP